MTAAALVCAAAICAPAASAGTDGPTLIRFDTGAAAKQDLRSPDTRDAARGVVPAGVGAPTAPRVEVVRTGADGFEWGDGAIGAGAGLLLALMGGAATVVARRRRTYRAATG
jgi:hypothetical protein